VARAVDWELEPGARVTVTSAASGSFTEAGAKQTAYLLWLGGSRSMGPWETFDVILAVFSGERLVGTGSPGPYNLILKAEDFDADGIHELLLEGSETRARLMTSAALVRWRPGHEPGEEWEVVHAFGGVRDHECGIGVGPSLQSQMGVLRYVPRAEGGMPLFHVDVYRAPCPPGDADPKVEEYRYAPGEAITF
jgi:hypothetical protein